MKGSCLAHRTLDVNRLGDVLGHCWLVLAALEALSVAALGLLPLAKALWRERGRKEAWRGCENWQEDVEKAVREKRSRECNVSIVLMAWRRMCE